MNREGLETRLRSLVKGNSPEERKKHALAQKNKGKKVIGLLCSYAPEEVIYAAGMLPWRVTGTWDSDLSHAALHRDLDSCSYCNHALEALLRGELEFLDGIVISDWDDDRRRLFDTWCYVSKPSFAAMLTAPKGTSEIFERYYTKEIAGLATALGDFGGQRINEAGLRDAIRVCNRTRGLMLQLYEWRKRKVPPVSGAELLGIATASMVMDKNEFNTELESLLPYLEQRHVGSGPVGPRILVSADMLDNPLFLEVIEGEGCQVVMDDLDTGSRYFHKLVDENAEDLTAALARRYCWRPADPVASNWEEQIHRIVEWVRDFRVDGVIALCDEFSPPRQWREPLLVREMARVNIPYVCISRGYDVGATGQFRTRVAAFLEMLEPGMTGPVSAVK